jgi:16S rRNA (cytidine1402-2'-O)-methyltransferase
MPGTLFVVATPIGNLEDLTLRALRILKEADLIACEDTRQTAKLLAHYQLHKPTTSYHEHNESQKTPQLIHLLEEGKRIALVSDAGTPCLSDPGYRLVHQAREQGIPVTPIPGPCSFIAALSASGRPTDQFTFLGFLPPKNQARRRLLESLCQEARPLIFFESPNRLLQTLREILATLGNRKLTVARELTKLYEEFFGGSVQTALDHFAQSPVRGELVLILEKGEKEIQDWRSLDKMEVRQRIGQYIAAEGISKSDAMKKLAKELACSKREIYRLLIEETPDGDPPER